MPLGKRKRTSSLSRSPSPKKQKKNVDDLQTWTVAELRNWLKENGEKVGGVKAVLIERVENVKAGISTSTPSTKKSAPRKSKRIAEKEDDSEEEEDDFDESESEEELEEIKAPSRRTSRRNIEKKEKEDNKEFKWEKYKSILYCNPKGSNDSSKIAAFDMDSTLIVTSTGKTFAVSRNDWVWMFECIPKKLKELHDSGYKVVIISNQKGIGTGKTSAATIEGKIEDLIESCGVPICSILATEEDEYRKPANNTWKFLCDKLVNVEVDLSESYYIGDAAGRPAGWKEGKKKDFGCSDRKFAINSGISFKTPEEFFLGEKPVEFDWYGIDPKEIKENKSLPYNEKDLISDKQEMVLFVGYPASGKSTFAKQYFVPNGYSHINRDTLKTQAKCLKVTKEEIADGKSVVIDNTNPSQNARQPYITAAIKANIPVRCFHFQTSFELAKHLNNFREVITNGESRHVPMVAYHSFRKGFSEPSLDEGFTEIKEIEFKRYHPDNDHKQGYEQWTERLR